MFVGEMREAAMWYKTPDQREHAKAYINEIFNYDELTSGLIFGPIVYSDADLNSVRAPEPPEEGAKLLIGEAKIIAIKPTIGEEFVLNLGTKDLNTLREVTQRAWLKYPDNKPMSVDDLDKVIAMTAPDVIDKMLRYDHSER